MSEKTAKNPKGAGRKPIELDEDMITRLAELHCTEREIAHVMGVSKDTIRRRYAHAIAKGLSQGKIKLRRAMMRNAIENQNAVIQIFLAKNLLGMENDPAGNSKDEDMILPWENDPINTTDEETDYESMDKSNSSQ